MSKPADLMPVGIWYTDDNLFTDPDNVTAAECELMAIVPEVDAHDYARYLYEESQNESDNWQTVQIFARPAVGTGWTAHTAMNRTVNTDPIVTALVDALAQEFGGVWEVTPTGGGCDAITCEGLLTDARRATLYVVANANCPVLGVDEGCSVVVLPKDGSGEDGQSYDTTARTGHLSGAEVADLVRFAIADTLFTPLPVVI